MEEFDEIEFSDIVDIILNDFNEVQQKNALLCSSNCFFIYFNLSLKIQI